MDIPHSSGHHDSPLFLIAVPSWNRAALIMPLYESLTAQDEQNWRLLLWSDGSTDSTAEQVLALQQQDPRVLFYNSANNSGCNQSRNGLLEWGRQVAPQGWMLFMDDDDLLLPGALATMAATIRAEPDIRWLAMTCSSNDVNKPSTVQRSGRLSYLRDYMFGKTIRGDMTHCIRLDVVGSARFTDEFKNGEEWFFFCQLALAQPVLVINQAGCLKNYQQNGLSATGINRKRKKQVLDLKLRALTPMVGARQMRHQMVSLAALELDEGQPAVAREWLAQVWRVSPFYMRQYRHWLRCLLMSIRAS